MKQKNNDNTLFLVLGIAVIAGYEFFTGQISTLLGEAFGWSSTTLQEAKNNKTMLQKADNIDPQEYAGWHKKNWKANKLKAKEMLNDIGMSRPSDVLDQETWESITGELGYSMVVNESRGFPGNWKWAVNTAQKKGIISDKQSKQLHQIFKTG